MSPPNYRLRQACGLCHRKNTLNPALSLGQTPIANEYLKEPLPQQKFPLDLVLCSSCGHLQMQTLIDPKRLFGDYVYTTGVSPVTIEHFTQQAKTIATRFNFSVTKNFNVIDIGSNDGTALRPWKDMGANVLGIDPAEQIAKHASSQGIPTIPAFFTSEMAQSLPSIQQADVIIANNVFAHAEDLNDIALGVWHLMGPSSVFILEVSYLADIIEHLAFDTIYHEHFSYHALTPLHQEFQKIGLKIIDVEINQQQIGRGSLRVYAACTEAPYKQSPRVDEVLRKESQHNFFDLENYIILSERIERFATRFKQRLDRRIESEPNICGYGAPAKLTTMMSVCGLDKKHCQFVVEDSQWKQGLLTPGSHIPILPPQALYNQKNTTCIIWAWNFAESIRKQNIRYPGLFIAPLPEPNPFAPKESNR